MIKLIKILKFLRLPLVMILKHLFRIKFENQSKTDALLTIVNAFLEHNSIISKNIGSGLITKDEILSIGRDIAPEKMKDMAERIQHQFGVYNDVRSDLKRMWKAKGIKKIK